MYGKALLLIITVFFVAGMGETFVCFFVGVSTSTPTKERPLLERLAKISC